MAVNESHTVENRKPSQSGSGTNVHATCETEMSAVRLGGLAPSRHAVMGGEAGIRQGRLHLLQHLFVLSSGVTNDRPALDHWIHAPQPPTRSRKLVQLQHAGELFRHPPFCCCTRRLTGAFPIKPGSLVSRRLPTDSSKGLCFEWFSPLASFILVA